MCIGRPRTGDSPCMFGVRPTSVIILIVNDYTVVTRPAEVGP
jgi:hypothetical protein